MRVYLLIISLCISVYVNSQEIIVAESQKLKSLTIGSQVNQVAYELTEEGFYSPGGPTVDDEGSLWFFPNGKDKILVLKKGVFFEIDYPDYYPKSDYPNHFPTINQQGVFGYYSGYPAEKIWSWPKSVGISHPRTINYNIPNGEIIEFSGWDGYRSVQYITSLEHNPNSYSMTENKRRTFTFRNPDQTRLWLPTQPGGFTIGADGLLYRNGVLWSAIPPNGMTGAKYLGRLKSDHHIWGVGSRPGMEGRFLITNAKAEVELTFTLPWRVQDGIVKEVLFNYGIGPWGELYALIAPPIIVELLGTEEQRMSDNGARFVRQYFDSSQPAELVVVRNHLKHFGRLNDGGVRLRKEPSTSAAIVGTYPAKTGFRILQTGTKEETIGGQTSVWHRVRLYDGTEGWFFGAFIHNLYDGPNGLPPPWPNVPDW